MWWEDVCALRARKGIDPRGRLFIEGLRMLEAARCAGVRFERALYAPAFFAEAVRARALLSQLEREGTAIHELAPREFSRLSYKADGVVAVVRHVQPSLDEIVLRPGLLVVLDALSDPGNIGSVLRSANAWGAAGVVAIDGEAKLFHPKSLRASMGAVFHTPACAADRSSVIERIAGRRVVALTPDGRAPWSPEHHASVVIFGNEKRGVHPDLASIAVHVAIPTIGIVDSLNVASAAAIVLWDAFRNGSL